MYLLSLYADSLASGDCRRASGMFTQHLTKYCLYGMRTDVMHGLLEQRCDG